MRTLEESYSYAVKGILKAVNPIKKKIIRTECTVHEFINNQSLIILKNDGYEEVHEFMDSYINDINAGVVWADQALKSNNHFITQIRTRDSMAAAMQKQNVFLTIQKHLRNTQIMILRVQCFS